MAKQKKQIADSEEREYVVPLRRVWVNVPKYRRAEKAIKALKQFLAKHLRVEDRDIKKIKVDKYVNEEIWFRGMRKPLNKIKVRVKKDKDVYRVFLVDISETVKFKMAKENKATVTAEKGKKKVVKEEVKEEETEEKKEEIEEKKEAGKEEMKELEKQSHKQLKHEQTSKKPPQIHRKALQK